MKGSHKLMSSTQADQFWDQVYAFCFWIRGVPLPEEARRSALKWSAPSSRLMRSMSSMDYFDANSDDEVDDEMLDEYSEAQMRVLHNLANGSASIGAEVPVPPKMRWRFEYARAMAGESGYILYPRVNRDGMSAQVGEQHHARANSTGSSNGSGGMIAACICPYDCGTYTEDLSRFLGHLMDEHAIPAKEGPRKDSGYVSGGDMTGEDEMEAEPGPETAEKVKRDKGKGREKSPDTKSQQAGKGPAFWQKLLTAQWSSELKSPKKRRFEAEDEEEELGAEAEAEVEKQPEKRQKADKLMLRLSLRTPCHHSLGTEVQATNFRHHMDGFYWADPYMTEKGDGDQDGDGQSRTGQTASHPQNGGDRIADEFMSGARDGGADGRSGFGTSDAESFKDEEWRFSCPHNKSCNLVFDSVVLFVEHLTERGFVTLGRPDQNMNRTRMTPKMLLAEWNMAGF